jgi:hypothetical protein
MCTGFIQLQMADSCEHCNASLGSLPDKWIRLIIWACSHSLKSIAGPGLGFCGVNEFVPNRGWPTLRIGRL